MDSEAAASVVPWERLLVVHCVALVFAWWLSAGFIRSYRRRSQSVDPPLTPRQQLIERYGRFLGPALTVYTLVEIVRRL